MSKADYEDRLWNQGIKIGINNQRVIPLIKNWCKHVVLSDMSAGMLAEMTQLPITLKISCPNTTVAWSGMQLEACANDFIIQACISCRHHEEISKNNLGVEVLKAHRERQEVVEAKKLSDQHKKAKLKAEAEKFIGVEKATSGITKLSVLNLVQQLDDETHQKEIASKILEAAKLKPGFFSGAAVDYISLFCDKVFGNDLLQGISTIVSNGLKISNFALENLRTLINEDINSDEAAGVISAIYSDRDLPLQIDLLAKILNNALYHDAYGMRHRQEDACKNAVAVFIRLSKLDRNQFDKLVHERVTIDDTIIRININGLLTDICRTDPDLVIPLLPKLIKSLDLTDDASGDSADFRIKQTLRALYFTYPEEVISEVNRQYPALSELAKIELLDFYGLILKDKETYPLFEAMYSFDIASDLVDKLLGGNKSSEIESKLVETLADIAKKRPELLREKFDLAFGYVITVIQKKITFNWYREELNKSDKPTTTFNPLAGLTYPKIMTEEMRIDRMIGFATKMTSHLVALDPDRNNQKILAAIKNLSSKREALLKCQLIQLLKDSVKDPVILSKLLPDVYNFLYDSESEEVREIGVRFAIQILNDFPNIVTQNLLATLKIFLKDQSVGVRGRAIEAYGIILRKYPEEQDSQSIQSVIDGLEDSYVFVHKSASRISYDIFPFLSPVQKAFWEKCLLIQEACYFKKGQYDYCEDLVDRLLFYTKVEPVIYKRIVTKILVKYIWIKEYYVVIKFLKKLNFIALQNHEFQEVWLKSALTFLGNTEPSRMGQEPNERMELIYQFYKIKPIVLTNNIKLFKAYSKSRVDNFYHRDVIECICILAFFGIWSELREFIGYCESKIDVNASNAFINNLVDKIKQLSDIETLVADKSLSRADIHKLIK